MTSLLSILSGTINLVVVVAAFSLIIIIHELGHFLAARWAGIRVLAFAVGFGPALVSYRPGLGWRRGSSEGEYEQLRQDSLGVAGERRESARAALSGRVKPTEYRINALPFGGYVKMLGQDDSDAGATSDAPDSYQRCQPWKRMIVISAGVTANLITAILLFIVVFRIGLLVEPAHVGAVEPGSPAAKAVAINATELGVAEPGLKAGDEVIAAAGQKLDSFNDLILATAMSRAGLPLEMDVRRQGVAEPLRFVVVPREDEGSHLLSIGVGPGVSNQIAWPKDQQEVKALRSMIDPAIAGAVVADARLTAVNGKAVGTPYAIDEAVKAASGAPVQLTFEDAAGGKKTVEVLPKPALEREIFSVGEIKIESEHLLGLLPVLAVRSVEEGSGAAKVGLKAGDVFVQLGSVEWPTVPAGVAEIRKNAGHSVKVVVLRHEGPGAWKDVDLGQAAVSGKGQIGFNISDTASTGSWIGRFPVRASEKDSGSAPSGAALPIPGGSRVVSVAGKPVETLGDVRAILAGIAATSVGSGAKVDVVVELPVAVGNAARPIDTIPWNISADELSRVRSLGYESPLPLAMFKPEQMQLQAASVPEAVGKGFKETRRVMTMTYLTFARLFEGSVKIEHLKGPVGIAHVGVVLLDRGWIWLMFFMALISVNLSVINFLPMPIADGGHMVYLIYEQITGRPPSVAFQNAAALAGIVLLGAVFLLVTYHDVGNVVRSIFGG